VHNAALVAQCHVATGKYVVCDCLPENLNAQDICYYLFRLSLNIWVYECDMVVATYYIAEG